jgi:methylated-DNA-protein-cysteine methyltransferase-like protein
MADRASDFAAIYAFVRAIPSGKVASYGDVGAAVGVTARTVGWAMSVAVDDGETPVPWHRVVGSDGYLRIARRSAALKALQQSLLENEGVTVGDNGCVPRPFFQDSDS